MKDFILEKTLPIRLVGFNEFSGSIEIMNFDLKFSMLTGAQSADPEHIREAQQNQSISFSKAITFLEGVVDNSLYLTPLTSDALYATLLGSYNNNIILLPDCAEVYLMNALHCKLNAITHEDTVIEKLELTDLDNKLTYTLISTEEESYDELPSDSEWLGEFSIWDTAWWNRGDVSTLDRTMDSKEEYDATMEKLDMDQIHQLNTAILREIEENITSMLQENGDIPIPQGELVEVDFGKKETGWKPKLV